MGKIQSSLLSIMGSFTSLAQLKTQRQILGATKMTEAEKKAEHYNTAVDETMEHEDLTYEEMHFLAKGNIKATETALEDNPTYENVLKRREAMEFVETTQELYDMDLEESRKATEAAEKAKIIKQEELRQQREGWLSGTPDRSIVIRGKGGDNE